MHKDRWIIGAEHRGVTMTQDFKKHWAAVRTGLLDLRHLFASNPSGAVTVDHFDESLGANELEIALHALCDCILAAPRPRITDAEIERIGLLHAKIELVDECVSSIRRKRDASGA
jgi:hypothetical protein